MITVEHSKLGPSIAVTGDDMYRLPAMYYAGLYEPNYPVPALQFPDSDLAAPMHLVAPRTKWLILGYLAHWRAR